jgi:uncharacterized membrane protein YjjB (DUF3815 family)
MDLALALTSSLWAGLMATAYGVYFAVPRPLLAVCLACGLAGRLARELLLQGGLPVVPTTVVAAAVVSALAIWATQGRVAAPVIAVAALVPLGASINALNMVAGIVQIPSTQDPATLTSLVTQVSADAVTALAIFAAIGLGFIVPYALLVRKPTL